ncbi:MAG: IMP dehydrogenase, partial [Nitrososphaera sp.]|nr:IMP dehydrogenase [Nitrososphaera sp.]
MPKLIEKFTYGFEDVSLEPHRHSSVYSRKDVDCSVQVGPHKLRTPILSSPMQDVTDDKLAIAMWRAGGLGCIHRFVDIKTQADMVTAVRVADAHCFAAIGTTEDCLERAAALIAAGASGLIVDVAFLNKRTLDICRVVKKNWPDIYLVSGNVATGAGFTEGVKAGLNGIRVGIGNGQACRTSRVTGVGIGLFTSLLECYEERQVVVMNGGPYVDIICDGGMDVGGSFCKALAAGADSVIMGRSFAASEESPARIVPTDEYGITTYADTLLSTNKGNRFKEYRGSASMEAQMVYKKAGEIVSSEGVASVVKVSGSVSDVLGRYNGALRSSMSYL